MISQLSAMFDRDLLASLMWTQLWQVTVLIVGVGLVTRLTCRHRPHLAYLLWMIVLLKCCLPPVWHSPTGVFCWTSPNHSSEATAAVHERGDRLMPRNDTRTASPAAVASSLVVSGTAMRAPTSDLVAPPFDAVSEPAAAPLHATLDAWLVIWLAGAMLSMLTWLANGWRWRRRVWHATLPAEALPTKACLNQLVDRLARRLGLRRSPRLAVVGEAIGPAVFGLFRPTLVLPASLVDGGNRGRLEAVVAHEMVHVRRGDLPIGLWQLATQAVWWFHPLVWWLNGEMARQRERSCDEEVLAALGGDPADYAQSLLDVLKLRRQRRFLPAWPGMRASEITRQRLEHIVRRGRLAHARTPRGYWLLAMATLLVTLPGAKRALHTAAAEDPSPAPTVEQRQVAFAPRESGEQAAEKQAAGKRTPGRKRRETRHHRQDDAPANADRDVDDGDADGRIATAPPGEPRWERAVDRATAYLKLQQQPNGTWNDPAGYPGGITALCTLALLKSGEKADAVAVRDALAHLRGLKPTVTYSTALAIMVFSAAEPARDRALIEERVEWLENTQKKFGRYSGAWGYPMAEGDNSNTSFAIRALYAADRAGVPASRDTWRRALHYWLDGQNARGSWGYKLEHAGSGSMTAAGIFSLNAALEVLGDDVDEETRQEATAASETAADWLGRNFTATQNPASNGVHGWRLYWLDMLGQAGEITGQKTFGEHDWLTEGAKALVAEQHSDGYWTGTGHGEDNPHVATAFAALFLSHGRDSE
jgi:beta-lactamase regulating signal transducer with metallopeptidase domain